MQTAVDPFQPLLSVIDRYRNDVHNLRGPATEDALAQAAQVLTTPIPRSLLRFLHRWNGAVLYRGVLQIRSVSELAPAADHVGGVIVFADGPTEADHWAYAHDEQGEAVFGRWNGRNFEPLHERFDAWLAATIHILDNNIREIDQQFEARIEKDPDCGYLLLQRAEHMIGAERMEEACELLRRATAANPGLVGAWDRLGQSLLVSDAGQARWALLKAFRGIRLPENVPTVYAPDANLVRTLSGLFPAGDDGWERELVHFLSEAVSDAGNYDELNMIEVAGVSLAQIHLDRNDRDAAHTVLVDLLERARAFQVRGPMQEAVLMLARIEMDLGHHDDAERRLRALRYDPRPTSDRARLIIGTIAASRQEPWCETILEECVAHLTEPKDRCEALLLLAERRLLRDQHKNAEAMFNQAQQIARAADLTELQARAALGIGDVQRSRGMLSEAAETYQTARKLAGDNTELLQRVLIRRGDLFRSQGDLNRAIEDYQRAADEYANLGLPIREAWARLRLAQVGVEGASEQAHALFKSVDHAAGVAASDSISGHPARSLEWHLNRASDHARDRWNAQRARPPLSRAAAVPGCRGSGWRGTACGCGCGCWSG